VEPITEREWGKLLCPLPDSADRVAVRQALEAAIRDYVDGADRDQRLRDVLRRIERHADSQNARNLCRDILELENLSPDSQAEAALRQLLPQVRSHVKALAAVYLSTKRRSRFMTAIARIWTDLGKGELRISETGPFVDFLSSICVRVDENRSLNGAGVKKFVKRERDRRDFLNSISEVLSASANMWIDEDLVYVVDASGQRKPG
jgi:hypothetical protein